MNIAIMMCGHMRNYKKCYQNFIDSIIEPNKEHSIDLFITTSNVNSQRLQLSPYMSPSSKIKNDKKYYEGHGIIYNVDEANLRKDICDTYKKLNVVDVHFVKENIEDNDIDPMSWEWFRRGIFSKPYESLNRVKKIQETQNKKYDVIVRTRPDLILQKKIKINKPESDCLYTFGGWPKRGKYEDDIYIVDFFCYGAMKDMETYTNIHKMYNPLPTKIKKHPYSSENQLYIYLKKHKINLKYLITSRGDYECIR
tara:strand:+ start:1707 stop:2465 length:759 start_codon:yes stop_codon:yes gene_type:complete